MGKTVTGFNEMFLSDTTKEMELCHLVNGKYKTTGVKTKSGIFRAHFTNMLLDLAGQICMGIYFIGEPFKIPAMRLCNMSTDLILDGAKHQDIKNKLAEWYPLMKPLQLAGWIDDTLDGHDDPREQIEFVWL